MREVAAEEIHDLAIGAAILGTGGGGDPYVGALLAEQAIREHGPVTLVDVAELDDDAFVVPIAGVGAPTIIVEKLLGEFEAAKAFDGYESYRGRAITHTTSAEAGGFNSTLPFAVAAAKRLPVVDADLMGRAYPRIEMVLPTLYGIAAGPCSLADEKGNVAIVETVDNVWTERLVRTMCVEMGCQCVATLYSMSGAEMKRASVPGTLGLAVELGRLVARERGAHGDPIGAVVERLAGRVLFRGKIVDVDRRTEGGWNKGRVVFDGLGADSGATLALRIQNEHLVAERDGEVVACVPDLIIVMDSETGEPITTEELRYGFRCTVIGAPCDPRWRTPEGLALGGPGAFGYDVEYVPVEERVAV
jgi:DUF917 family protein